MQVLAPVVRGRKGEHSKLMQDFQKQGYVRVMIDGEMYELDDTPALDKKKKHDISIVIDRLIIRNSDDFRKRLADSLETAAKAAEGLVLIDLFEKGTLLFSQNYACADCGISIEELSHRACFHSTAPTARAPRATGWAPSCASARIPSCPTRRKPSTRARFRRHGLEFFGSNQRRRRLFPRAGAKKYKFSLDTPFQGPAPEGQGHPDVWHGQRKDYRAVRERPRGREIYHDL